MSKYFKDSILLVTSSFPYSPTSETFILDEINYIKQNPSLKVNILAFN